MLVALPVCFAALVLVPLVQGDAGDASGLPADPSCLQAIDSTPIPYGGVTITLGDIPESPDSTGAPFQGSCPVTQCMDAEATGFTTDATGCLEAQTCCAIGTISSSVAADMSYCIEACATDGSSGPPDPPLDYTDPAPEAEAPPDYDTMSGDYSGLPADPSCLQEIDTTPIPYGGVTITLGEIPESPDSTGAPFQGSCPVTQCMDAEAAGFTTDATGCLEAQTCCAIGTISSSVAADLKYCIEACATDGSSGLPDPPPDYTDPAPEAEGPPDYDTMSGGTPGLPADPSCLQEIDTTPIPYGGVTITLGEIPESPDSTGAPFQGSCPVTQCMDAEATGFTTDATGCLEAQTCCAIGTISSSVAADMSYCIEACATDGSSGPPDPPLDYTDPVPEAEGPLDYDTMSGGTSGLPADPSCLQAIDATPILYAGVTITLGEIPESPESTGAPFQGSCPVAQCMDAEATGFTTDATGCTEAQTCCAIGTISSSVAADMKYCIEACSTGAPTVPPTTPLDYEDYEAPPPITPSADYDDDPTPPIPRAPPSEEPSPLSPLSPAEFPSSTESGSESPPLFPPPGETGSILSGNNGSSPTSATLAYLTCLVAAMATLMTAAAAAG